MCEVSGEWAGVEGSEPIEVDERRRMDVKLDIVGDVEGEEVMGGCEHAVVVELVMGSTETCVEWLGGVWLVVVAGCEACGCWVKKCVVKDANSM